MTNNVLKDLFKFEFCICFICKRSIFSYIDIVIVSMIFQRWLMLKLEQKYNFENDKNC